MEQNNAWHWGIAPSATTGFSCGWYHRMALKTAPQSTSDSGESWRLNEVFRLARVFLKLSLCSVWFTKTWWEKIPIQLIGWNIFNITEKGISVFWEDSAPQSQLGVASNPKMKQMHSEGRFLPGGKPKLSCWAAIWSSGSPARCRQPVPSTSLQPGSTSLQPWVSTPGLQQGTEQILSNCKSVGP